MKENTRYFREKITEIGLEVLPGEHPIVPVMFGDAKPAVKQFPLDERMVYEIPISLDAPTTLMFCST